MLFLLIFCFATAFNAFGQAKEITPAEYYQYFRAAVQKPFNSAKRITTTTLAYGDDGEAYLETKIVEEFLNPDKRRYAKTQKSHFDLNKIELIQIGETYYCREDNEVWKQSDDCKNQGFSFSPQPTSSKITFEDTKLGNLDAKVYKKYITYEVKSAGGNSNLLFEENKFWLDNKGVLLREETIRGNPDKKKLDYKETSVYEYDLKNIKIEAPIIKEK